MQTEPNSTPSPEDIYRVWRNDRRMSSGSAVVYMQRIKLFRAYCVEQGLAEREELTLERVSRFIDWYAKRRNLDPRSLGLFRSALQSLNRVYHRLGLAPPSWRSPGSAKPPATPLLAAYADYLLRHRGNPPAAVNTKLRHVGMVEAHLAQVGVDWLSIALVDIDAFLISYSKRYSRSHVSVVAGNIRCFLRFLHWSGRISVDLSDAVVAPVQRRLERPRRALPWEDVQRLLKAVDRSTPIGLRDYALLLMMSTYGLGAGEAIRLQFEDIDWEAGTLSVVRPKTGMAFTLPLLPTIAKAVADYLQDGRPIDTLTRHVFVQMHVPFGPLRSATAIRHIIAKHASVAGISAPFLGSHVLRHSHAARQIDLGAPPRVVSEILGHHDPESLSAYVRIATETLRDVALPVPV